MKTKNVLVRVLVATTDDGHWVAEGRGRQSLKAQREAMNEGIHHEMTPPIQYHLVKFRVPIPPKPGLIKVDVTYRGKKKARRR